MVESKKPKEKVVAKNLNERGSKMEAPSPSNTKSGGSTLLDFLEQTRFTGIVRGTDVMDKQGRRIVSTFMATFEDSVMTGLSSATFIVDDKGVRKIETDEGIARREVIVKMLSKPVSSLEISRQKPEEAEHSDVKKISLEEWEVAKHVARQILSDGQSNHRHKKSDNQ